MISLINKLKKKKSFLKKINSDKLGKKKSIDIYMYDDSRQYFCGFIHSMLELQ